MKFVLLLSFLALSILPLSAPSQPKWEKLQGVTYKADQWNDGDSFNAMHNGKEYIFQLYFVDTPESNDRFPDRNNDQATYFGITAAQALKVGEDAVEFTKKALSKSPFTVWVCGQDAMGSSSLPRQYAIIETGGKDLADLPVENGLARIYGKKITAPDGRSSTVYVKDLDGLEAKAKMKKKGGWSF